jgi:hypothetical protein
MPFRSAIACTHADHVHGRWDRLAMGLSGLCVVHCVATALMTAILASAGAALANPAFHEIGFALAMGIGAIALARGYRLHGNWRPVAIGATGLLLMGAGLLATPLAVEIALTVPGVLVLACAHRLNMRLDGKGC